jgi:hypothetical protein
MSLVDIMLEQLAAARRIVEDGQDVVPAWRVNTPEGSYLVLTPFDTDKPERRERALLLITRFMAWKLATSFVVTAQTWMGGGLMRSAEEALIVVGISHHERRGLIQKISGTVPVSFQALQWLDADQIDETYFHILPTGAGEITIEEIAELTSIFGEGGEMQAELLS